MNRIDDYGTANESERAISDAKEYDFNLNCEDNLGTVIAGLNLSAQDTGEKYWRLEMPFDGVEINLPPDAGEKDADYSGKVIWSVINGV